MRDDDDDDDDRDNDDDDRDDDDENADWIGRGGRGIEIHDQVQVGARLGGCSYVNTIITFPFLTLFNGQFLLSSSCFRFLIIQFFHSIFTPTWCAFVTKR